MNSRDENASLAKSCFKYLYDILLIYVAYFLCRVIFFAVNYSHYSDIFDENFWTLFKGSLVFDTSGILYMNLPFTLLALFPLHFKEISKNYTKILKWAFIIFNGIGILANIVDVRYFNWTERRSTASIFREFSNEDNILSVLGLELISQWYLVLAFALIMWLLWKMYANPLTFRPERNILSYIKYYIFRIAFMVLVVMFSVFGMRGGIDRVTRPITISNANLYIQSPIQAPLILNTPFSIIRTIGKKPFADPKFFDSEELLEAIYTPVHQPVDSLVQNNPNKNKNVVILIVESLGREYIGKYNRDLDNGNYKGYTPFIDSLMEHSMWFQQSFGNGRKSIDGMPAVLSGIPYLEVPFILSPASFNKLDGIAVQLGSIGYQTGFFHGAKNGSMGFDAYANATGFQKSYGRNEFCNEPKYGGDSQYDGYWAIWDEPFLQYYADEMSKMKEPFLTAVFTASNHHPYHVPDQYRDIFTEDGIVIHKCTKYTDNSIRLFFDNVKKQPWFNNTLFVICNDHTNLSDHEEYQTDLGLFGGTIIFYAPGDSTLVGERQGIAQQIDIMPTILSYLGYDKPYLSFGIDLLTTKPEDTFHISYTNGFYQILMGGYFVQFDGKEVRAIYDIEDKLLKNNLLGKVDVSNQLQYLKAFVQQYMSRMVENRLTVQEEENN